MMTAYRAAGWCGRAVSICRITDLLSLSHDLCLSPLLWYGKKGVLHRLVQKDLAPNPNLNPDPWEPVIVTPLDGALINIIQVCFLYQESILTSLCHNPCVFQFQYRNISVASINTQCSAKGKQFTLIPDARHIDCISTTGSLSRLKSFPCIMGIPTIILPRNLSKTHSCLLWESSLFVVHNAIVPDIKCAPVAATPRTHSLLTPKPQPIHLTPPSVRDGVSKLLLRDANNPQSRPLCVGLVRHTARQPQPSDLVKVLQHPSDELIGCVIVHLAVALELEKLSNTPHTRRFSKLEINSVVGVIEINVLLRPDLVPVLAFHQYCDLALSPSLPATIPRRRED